MTERLYNLFETTFYGRPRFLRLVGIFTIQELADMKIFSKTVMENIPKLKLGTKLKAGKFAANNQRIIMLFDDQNEDGFDLRIAKRQSELETVKAKLDEVASGLLKEKSDIEKHLARLNKKRFEDLNKRESYHKKTKGRRPKKGVDGQYRVVPSNTEQP